MYSSMNTVLAASTSSTTSRAAAQAERAAQTEVAGGVLDRDHAHPQHYRKRFVGYAPL